MKKPQLPPVSLLSPIVGFLGSSSLTMLSLFSGSGFLFSLVHKYLDAAAVFFKPLFPLVWAPLLSPRSVFHISLWLFCAGSSSSFSARMLIVCAVNHYARRARKHRLKTVFHTGYFASAKEGGLGGWVSLKLFCWATYF